MTITPDQASALRYEGHTVETPKVKEGKDGGNWQVQYEDSYWNQLPDAPYEDAALYAAAPDLAQTIAGMREEWAVEMYHDVDDTWRRYTTWVATREGASQHLTADPGWARQYRLARRLVGPVEVVEP